MVGNAGNAGRRNVFDILDLRRIMRNLRVSVVIPTNNEAGTIAANPAIPKPLGSDHKTTESDLRSRLHDGRGVKATPNRRPETRGAEVSMAVGDAPEGAAQPGLISLLP